MTLQELRYLVALAEHGHFGRAATACNVSQSTLSTQIKNLELQLGVKLFERTTKSVSVTAVGREIAGRARQVLEEVDAIMSVAHHHIGAPVRRFQPRRHPDARALCSAVAHTGAEERLSRAPAGAARGPDRAPSGTIGLTPA